MKMKITKKQALIGLTVIVLILLALWYWKGSTAQAPAPVDEQVATTTDEVIGSETPAPTPSKPNTLPPEPVFVLPEGATALDDYAFILNDQVYFRSLTNKEPLAIPKSDADSFEKISDFQVFPGTEIVEACGASATYGYYADDKAVYFYQFWRSPKFRSSTIEVIVDANKDDFKVSGVTTALDGKQILKVSYEKTEKTCKLVLSKVAFEKTN